MHDPLRMLNKEGQLWLSYSLEQLALNIGTGHWSEYLGALETMDLNGILVYGWTCRRTPLWFQGNVEDKGCRSVNHTTKYKNNKKCSQKLHHK